MSRLPKSMPHWAKYDRTQVMGIVKRRLKHLDNADPAFLDDFKARVEKSLNLDSRREFYDVAEIEVDVHEQNTAESMARGELMVRIKTTLNDGSWFQYAVGYRRARS